MVFVLAAMIAGTGLGYLMVLAAFDHNPQGEFFDPQAGVVVWSSTLAVFFSWAVAAAITVLVAELITWFVVRAAMRIVGRTSQ